MPKAKTPPTTDAPAKPRRKTRAQASAPPALMEDAIASRAYELFMQRGGEHGRALEDWVAAERELSGGA